MSPVRVVVACQQRLMREAVVDAITQQSSVHIIGEVKEPDLLSSFVEQNTPDVVILAMGDSGRRPHLVDELLQRHPSIKVIALAPDRNQALFYWISPVIQSRQIEYCEQGLTEALLNCAVRGRTGKLSSVSKTEEG